MHNHVPVAQVIQPASAKMGHSIRAQPAMPLVSIVTPSYNQAAFLRQTIESVLSQTYPRIEYVVMDGGSSDGSVDILRSYGDQFHWVSEPDGGQTAAINKGLGRCHGEILAYLNSDDLLLPHAVQRIVERFRMRPDLDLVYGNANYIDRNGTITHRYASAAFSFRRLMQDCMICQPAAFWTRRIAQTIGPFDETLTCSMDYDYWLRIGAAGAKAEFIPDDIACSRLYAETKTMRDRGTIYNENFRICMRHGGYVHLSLCHGYVDYLVKERKSRLWTRLASSEASLCRWSRHFCIFKNAGIWGFPGVLLRQRVFFLKDRPERAGPFLRDPFVWRAVRNFRRVLGVSPDGWLCDFVRFYSPKSEQASRPAEWWFSGVPTRDMGLTVSVNGRVRHRQALRHGEPVRISFPADTEGGMDVRILFSDYTVDRSWRKLSFFLHGSSFLSADALEQACAAALPYFS